MKEKVVPLTQIVANSLLGLEKYCVDPEKVWHYPRPGTTIEVPLKSADGREFFSLDVEKHRISLSKFKVQSRARRTWVLARLDFGGPPHQNPDGSRIDGSHLHIYNEEYGDKVAIPLSELPEFCGAAGMEELVDRFMTFCHVVERPKLQKEVELI